MAFNFFKKNKSNDEKSSAGSKYLNLKVSNIIQETNDAITIVFEQPENKINYKSSFVDKIIAFFYNPRIKIDELKLVML